MEAQIKIENIINKVKSLLLKNKEAEDKIVQLNQKIEVIELEKNDEILSLKNMVAENQKNQMIENNANEEAMRLLRTKLDDLLLEKVNLENKINFYKLAPENLSKKQIREKIDSYIYQIDECIKLLENK